MRPANLARNYMAQSKLSINNDPVFQWRERFTIAQINAGATVLPAVPGYKYRVVDIALIAIGGAVVAATTVDITGTQGGSVVKLLAAAVAGLTENTLLRAGATNAAILAAGTSFSTNDVNKGIGISKTGGAATTATHVDVLITYALVRGSVGPL